MLQFCLWLMLALRWSARENGLLAVLLLVRDMPASASSRRNALLQLSLLLCCCCWAAVRVATSGLNDIHQIFTSNYARRARR
jgi:hypothetical protein